MALILVVVSAWGLFCLVPLSASLPPTCESTLCFWFLSLSSSSLPFIIISDSSHLSPCLSLYPNSLREKGPGYPDSLTLDVERVEFCIPQRMELEKKSQVFESLKGPSLLPKCS